MLQHHITEHYMCLDVILQHVELIQEGIFIISNCNSFICIRDELRDTTYNCEDESTITEPSEPSEPPVIPPNPSIPIEEDDWGIPLTNTSSTATATASITSSLFDFTAPSSTTTTTNPMENLSSLLGSLKTKTTTSTINQNNNNNSNTIIHPSSILSFNSPSIISNEFIFPSFTVDV